MSIASSLSAAFFMLSIVAVLLLLTSLVGAQEPTYLSLAEKTYAKPTTVRAPGFELASSVFDEFGNFPEDNLKYYGREPHGPLEVRNVLYKKAEIQHDRSARQSEILVDNLLETSGVTVSSISSANYRPPPPPVRREVFMNARCSFDAEKWAMHPQSSISNAVMFYRLTGVSCQKCLKICESKQKKPWACRSVSYDHRWAICDLFAVTSSAAPFFLVDYDGRDYFEYLAALPPVGDDLVEAHAFSHKEEESTIIDCKRVLDQEQKNVAAGVKNVEKSSKTSYEAIPIAKPEILKTTVKPRHNYFTQLMEIKFKDRFPVVRSGETPSSSASSTEDGSKEETHEEIKMLGERIEHESLELFSSSTEKPVGTSVLPQQTPRATNIPQQIFVPTATTIFPEIEEEFSVVTPNYLRTTQREATEVSAEMRVHHYLSSVTTVKPTEVERESIDIYSDKKHFDGGREIVSDQEENEELIEAIKEELGNELHEDYKPDFACSDNRHVVMIDFVSTSRTPFSSPVRRLLARSLSECRSFCANDPNCLSAIYAPTACELANTKATYPHEELIYSPSCSYSQKLCIPYTIQPNRVGAITAFMNYMLVGNVEVVETTTTLEKCVIACLDAYDIYDVRCESAMFIADDKQQNCILNSASRLTDPKRFVPVYEMNNVVSKFVYFEFAHLPQKAASKHRQRRMKDSIDYNFTKWSTCLYNSTTNENYGRKYKYEKCSKDDIRKCPKHSTFCTAGAVSN